MRILAAWQEDLMATLTDTLRKSYASPVPNGTLDHPKRNVDGIKEKRKPPEVTGTVWKAVQLI